MQVWVLPFLLLYLWGANSEPVPAPRAPIIASLWIKSLQLAARKHAFKIPGAWSLPAYTHVCTLKPLPELGDEGSGITHSNDSNTYWAVSRDPVPSIHELSSAPKMNHLRMVKLGSLTPDPEGVTWIGDGRLAVVCEETGNIVGVDIGSATPPPAGQSPALWDAPQTLITNLEHIKHKKNDFLEGVAYDFRTQTLLVAQERKPKQILRVSLDSRDPQVLFSLEEPVPEEVNQDEERIDEITAKQAAFADEEPSEGEKKEKKKESKERKGKKKRQSRHPVDELIKDISGLAIAPNGDLFLLSQASQYLVQVDPSGRLLEGMDVDLPWPEGITFSHDGRFLVLLTEGSGDKPSAVAVYSTDASFCA